MRVRSCQSILLEVNLVAMWYEVHCEVPRRYENISETFMTGMFVRLTPPLIFFCELLQTIRTSMRMQHSDGKQDILE